MLFSLIVSFFIEEPVKPSLQYSESIIIERTILLSELPPEPPQASPVIVEEEVEEYNVLCECVATARIYSSFNIPYKDAVDIQPQGTPVVGGLILLQYGEVSHVGVIMAIFPGGVFIREGNFTKCKYSERFIEWNSKNVRGFWSD